MRADRGVEISSRTNSSCQISQRVREKLEGVRHYEMLLWTNQIQPINKY